MLWGPGKMSPLSCWKVYFGPHDTRTHTMTPHLVIYLISFQLFQITDLFKCHLYSGYPVKKRKTRPCGIQRDFLSDWRLSQTQRLQKKMSILVVYCAVAKPCEVHYRRRHWGGGLSRETRAVHQSFNTLCKQTSRYTNEGNSNQTFLI